MSKKHGRIRLKTLSPVFIGSGSELKKTEYFLDRAERKAYVLNTSRFFRFLIEHNLQDSYERFIMGGSKNSFNEWVKYQNQISVKDIKELSDYSLDIGEADIRHSDIKTFVKDSYGEVYIPGSGLKGALRTIILQELIRNGKLPDHIRENITEEVFSRERKFNRKAFLRRGNSGVEGLLQRKNTINETDIVDKWMSGIRISDSDIISKTDLILCEKEDYRPDGKKAFSKIPILRECLKPGVEIDFSFSINDNFPYSMNDITEMIKSGFEKYQQEYLGSYSGRIEYPECVLPLGGGVGFVSKTLIYSIYPKRQAVKVAREILQKQFWKHKHKTDEKISPRMRKMTHYQGKLFDMGLCTFSWGID